jgi:hypothetical protein
MAARVHLPNSCSSSCSWSFGNSLIGVGATDPMRVPPAMAFQMVWFDRRNHDWYGSGAPKTGLSPKKGSLLAQNSCASAVSLTSWSAMALGLSSLIHLAKELVFPLMCPCKEVTLALRILKLAWGPGRSASPSLGTRVQLVQRGLRQFAVFEKLSIGQ